MAEYSKENLISALKDMQTEITAIRYYNNKLASLKKEIDTSSIDPSAYDTSSASRIIQERDHALSSLKKPEGKKNIFDIILYAVFAVFSAILMIMLFPGNLIPLPLAVLNIIFLGYGVLYSVFFAAIKCSVVGKVYDSIPKVGRYVMLAALGLSAIAYVIDGILRPIFFIVVCPIALGFLMLLAKDKENKRLAASAQVNAQNRLRAKYDKLLNDARRSDEAEKARFEADLEAERIGKQKKHASVIAECTKALSKHKAKFNEVNILPAQVLKKDTYVVDSLLKILASDQADDLDGALVIWEKTLLSREEDFAQVYVSASIRRRDGWGPIRNMMYVDGAKVGTAEQPHKIIKVVPGTHAITAKVQLNYGGQSHYPQSEPVEITLNAGDVKYVKFFVSGTPTVQYRICRDMDEFSAEI